MTTVTNVVEKLEFLLRKCSLALAAVGCAALLLMLVLVCANILMRPFGGSVRGTLEMSGYLCALAVGLCMPAAQLAGSHIRAGLWAESLPGSVQKLELGLGNLACAFLLGLLARELYGIGSYVFFMGEYIDGFGFSYIPMIIGFGLGIFMHSLLFVLATLKTFLGAPRPGHGDDIAEVTSGTLKQEVSGEARS